MRWSSDQVACILEDQKCFGSLAWSHKHLALGSIQTFTHPGVPVNFWDLWNSELVYCPLTLYFFYSQRWDRSKYVRKELAPGLSNAWKLTMCATLPSISYKQHTLNFEIQSISIRITIYSSISWAIAHRERKGLFFFLWVGNSYRI